jgi:imidazolonepropionase-like amidohydrolase
MFRSAVLAVAIAPALPVLGFYSSAAAAQDNSPASALQCERLFDSRSGKLLGAHTVVVRNGKIAEVRPGKSEVTGAKTIDLAGRTCSPGWTDLHVHLGQQSSPRSYEEGFRLDDVDFALRGVSYARKTLMAGFTSVRDLGGEVAPHLRDAINAGMIEGPRVWAAGKSIATTGGHADPTNGYNSALSHLIGPPGPTEGVINSIEDASATRTAATSSRSRLPAACSVTRVRPMRRSFASTKSPRSSRPRAITATKWPRTRTAQKA